MHFFLVLHFLYYLFNMGNKAYEDLVEDCKVMKNIDDQSARTLVYNGIKLLLPDIIDANLHVIYRDRDR